jgi:hypothetical protein
MANHCAGFRLRLRDQGAQGAFAPRVGTPFVALEFGQAFAELGVGFGWHPGVADDRVELRCPDFADARPGLGATARAQTIVNHHRVGSRSAKGEVGPSKKK